MTNIYTHPVDNLISLTAAKLHLKVENTTDDELIKSMIAAACDWCKLYEGQTYMMTSYKKHLDDFKSVTYLKFPPVISIDSITYIDTAGATQTLASSVYTLDSDSMPARLYLAYGQSWPSIRDVPKAITITYTAGYTTTFSTSYATDLVTVGNVVFADTNRVRVTTDSGDLPAGISTNTDYYVVSTSGSTLKLSATSGGSAVTLTDDGTGTHYIGFADRGNVPDRVISAVKLVLTHLYEHRSEVTDFQNYASNFAAKNLLMERIF